MIQLNADTLQMLRQQLSLLFVFTCSVVALSKMGWGQEATTPIPHDPIGRMCKIQVKSDGPNTKTEYTGKLVRLTSKHLVLDQVTRYGTNERGVPLLDKVPYVERLFKNVGIASESIAGKKKIPRTQIVAFEFMSPSVKQPKPLHKMKSEKHNRNSNR